MLERERDRIAQDMHDDIGAGLTKIAMISETPVKEIDPGYEIRDSASGLPAGQAGMRDRLDRIASSSRDMISRTKSLKSH